MKRGGRTERGQVQADWYMRAGSRGEREVGGVECEQTGI